MKTIHNNVPKPTHDEPVVALNKVVIEHPRMSRAIKRIDKCRQMSKSAREPECMLVIGQSGVGKTTIKDHYLSKNPPKETKNGTIVPVLAVTTPVLAKMDTIAAAILASLGDPMPYEGKLEAKTKRLYALLKRCRVELIFLDEFHHLIDRDKAKVLRNVSDWLKNFISETKIPVVLMGLPSCQQIIDSNEQLRRRFSSQLNVGRFEWRKPRRPELKKFLSVLQENLPIESTVDFGSDDMAQRFWGATNGNISRIIKVTKGAVFIAQTKGTKLLDQQMLAYSLEERLKLRGDHGNVAIAKDNPFHPEWRYVPIQKFTTAPNGSSVDSSQKKAKTKGEIKEDLRQML